MPLFDAISSLFSHRAVSSVTSPSVSAIGDNSSVIAVNGYSSGKRGGCDACNTIEIDEPSCGKVQKQKKDDTWRIQLLEELRSLEENANISEKEHQQTKEFLLQQLEHYEKELLKVREHDVIVKEHRIPIPVHVPVHVPVRVPVVQRETRVISTSPCRSSLGPWRGPSTAGCSRSFRPVRANSCNRCRSAGGLAESASIARLVNGATSPCAVSRGGSCNRYGIDVNRYKSRLDELSASEQAITKRLSARRSVTSKVQRTLSKLTRAHEEEQRHLAKIADDKRKTVSRAFKELQERKEEEYRSHAERINADLRTEQERLSEHMSKLQDWREAKMMEMRRLEESAAIALRSYDSSLRRQLGN